MALEESENVLYTMLQLSDSAFPTGGYAHSLGCEAALQRSFLGDTESVKTFAVGCLENAGSFSLPFVRAAYEASYDHPQLCSLDSLYDVSLLNHVANRSSVQQGRQQLYAAQQVTQHPNLDALQCLLKEDKMKGHQAIVSGAIYASLNIPLPYSLRMYMFGILRTIVSSIVRLGKPLGTMEAQRMQFQLQLLLGDIIKRNESCLPKDACISYPLAEVFQNSHDRLFHKLFVS